MGRAAVRGFGGTGRQCHPLWLYQPTNRTIDKKANQSSEERRGAMETGKFMGEVE